MGRPRKQDYVAVALDFGTGTIFLAVRYHDGRIEVLRDPDGNSPTMSAIAFEDGDPKRPLFGIAALNYRQIAPQWVATMNKRALYGHPGIPLMTDKNGKEWTCVELSALYVKHLIDAAAASTGKKVNIVVLAVPAFWDSGTRQLYCSIIEKGGYKTAAPMNEPTAALYGFGVETSKPGTYLVLDCGMGTSDVTIMRVGKNEYIVLATAGRDDSAGREMTRALIGRCVEEMAKRNVALDPQRDLREYILLENAVEAAKLQLSSQRKTFITWRAGGELFDLEVTRQEYEALIASILQEISSLVDEALNAAGLTPEQTDGVLAVGGACRTPAIQSLLVARFGEKKILESIDRDTAVVKGAAAAIGIKVKETIEAGNDHELAAIAPEYALQCEDKLREVTGADLGVEAIDVAKEEAAFLSIIPANTPLPHESTKVCGLRDETGSGTVPIRVLQGQASRPLADAHELAVFRMDNLPPGRTKDRIEISFSIDSSGIVAVRAKDLESNQEIIGEVDASEAVTK